MITKLWRLRARPLTLLLLLLSFGGPALAYDLDYSRAFLLDAESLAEQGIVERYAGVLPSLRNYVVKPLVLREKINSERGTYAVVAGNHTYPIFPSPLGGDQYESWGVATVVFFEIVNRQLAKAPVKLYAINSGNDLMGMFLTEREAAEARRNLKHSTDWPYIPKMETPWFGQYH